MSRFGKSPSLTRHRLSNVAEGGALSPQQSFEDRSLPSTRFSPPPGSPAPGKHADGLHMLFGSKKTKAFLRRHWKTTVIPVLMLLIFFGLEWRFLRSLAHGRFSIGDYPANSTEAIVQAKKRPAEPRLMYERLVGLATHALAEGESKTELDELWKEPITGSSKWTQCSEKRPPGHLGPPEPRQSSGYIMVSADGGLNQQRVAICNAVAVARLLNATLVVPNFLFSNVWMDTSQFGDIYEQDYFIDFLKDDVRIVYELPLELQSLDLAVMGSVLTNVEIEKESRLGFFVESVLPILLQNRVVHFYGFENAVTSDPVPFDLQRLRCRCNFHALKFKRHIRDTAGIMLKRMRENSNRWGPTDDSLSAVGEMSKIERQLVGDIDVPGSTQKGTTQVQSDDDNLGEKGGTPVKYLGLHLRFEIDMVAYSLCEFGGGEPEQQELAEYRRVHFPTVSKYQAIGKLMTADMLREVGRCPLTPEEGVLMLASLGFKRSTRIFLAGAQIYGGQARLAPISYLYPNLVSKEDLLTPEELAPFLNHSSQMAALDFIGCAAADAFAMTDSGSQLSSLAAGYRIYYGEGRLPTIRPNKKRLASIFAKNMTVEWEEFEEQVRKTVRDSKRLLLRPISRSPYRHPRCEECMCHRKN